MLKRILGIFLCITMLFLATFPVTAVNSEETTGGDTEATPTLESILNDYHAKSAALSAESTAEASAYSRNASKDPQDQLKQETIAELNNAGYAAYDVNPSTYQSLERQLSTDFSEMGLDPDGSYIVVISGEEDTQNQTSPGNNSRVITLPPHVWEGDNLGFFSYTYNGIVYEMRYLTVSPDRNSELGKTSPVEFFANDDPSAFGDFLNASIFILAEVGAALLPGGTIFGILSTVESNLFDDDYVTPLSASLEYRGSTSWHITYTQIYDSSTSGWRNGSSVEYVNMRYFIDYNYYDSTTGQYEEISTNGLYDVRYSEFYEDEAWRKQAAVLGFIDWLPRYDIIPYVTYEFHHPDLPGEIVETITHERWREPTHYQP